jgi:hypothetical protein
MKEGKVRINCFFVPIMASVMTGLVFGQECPKWGDKVGALQFLQQNKTHGTDADPTCVDRAFATLSHANTSVEVFVGLLDFERSTKRDDFKTYDGRYPAIDALVGIGTPVVPYLINAISESDSELVRTNAAHALGSIHGQCVDVAITMLENEAKIKTSGDQQARLRAAQEYVRKTYRVPCKTKK